MAVTAAEQLEWMLGNFQLGYPTISGGFLGGEPVFVGAFIAHAAEPLDIAWHADAPLFVGRAEMRASGSQSSPGAADSLPAAAKSLPVYASLGFEDSQYDALSLSIPVPRVVSLRQSLILASPATDSLTIATKAQVDARLASYSDQIPDPATFTGRVILDYEPFNRNSIPTSIPFEDVLAALAAGINRLRESLPMAELANFGVPSSTNQEGYPPKGVLHGGEEYADLAAVVDFVAHHIYTANATFGGGDKAVLSRRMEEAAKFGKPMLPFFHPQLPSPTYAFIDIDEITARFDYLRDNFEAIGVVYWSARALGISSGESDYESIWESQLTALNTRYNS